jgi:hypothetical protein
MFYSIMYDDNASNRPTYHIFSMGRELHEPRRAERKSGSDSNTNGGISTPEKSTKFASTQEVLFPPEHYCTHGIKC